MCAMLDFTFASSKKRVWFGVGRTVPMNVAMKISMKSLTDEVYWDQTKGNERCTRSNGRYSAAGLKPFSIGSERVKSSIQTTAQSYPPVADPKRQLGWRAF